MKFCYLEKINFVAALVEQCPNSVVVIGDESFLNLARRTIIICVHGLILLVV